MTSHQRVTRKRVTGVSDAYFVRIGSRASKSNTVHIMRDASYRDHRGNAIGSAYCGVTVREMDFSHEPAERLAAKTCKRCAKAEARAGEA